MIKVLSPIALCLATSTALAQSPCIDPNLGTQMTLADDAFSAILPLGFTFNYAGVPYTDVQVCSNGFIVMGAGAPGTPSWTPLVADLLANVEVRICPMWRDLSPNQAGSGQVWYNAVAASGLNPAYFSVTWDGVQQYGTTIANTMQIRFIDGDAIEIFYDAGVLQGTDNWLVGASPGNGATANPVLFSALPTPITTTVPTLHEDGSGGFAVSSCVVRWTAAGAGFVVTSTHDCASKSTYGQGCLGAYASFYEYFPDQTLFDLENTSISGLFTGAGYVITQGLTTFLPPSLSAMNLQLGDDAFATVTLTAPFPYPGGSTSMLEVCSNGFISVSTANSNGTPYNPNVNAFLTFPNPTWACWHDYTPTALNNVWAEEIGGVLYVTWDAVGTYQQVGSASTFQFQFDTSSGFWHLVWLTMDTGPTTWIPTYIVGYSPANGAGDPGSVDLTPVTTGAVTIATTAVDTFPLDLQVDARPVVNTTINFTVSAMSTTAAFGGLLYGLSKFDPGVSLTSFGMPGCFQYNDMLAVQLFFPSGASSVAVPYTVPNLVGVFIQLQAAVYDPVGMPTPLGAVSSQGAELAIGN